MASQIRFGDYLSKVSVQHNKINYNQLTPKPEKDSNGKLIPIHPKKLTFTPVDIVRLLKPYLGVRIMEQLQAVIPLGLYLALFQILMLRQDVTDSWVITMGLGAVIIGLMLFMEGLKLGLMPFGEVIGNGLPKKIPSPGSTAGRLPIRYRCHLCGTCNRCTTGRWCQCRCHQGPLPLHPSQ